jgi:hypothetical protein
MITCMGQLVGTTWESRRQGNRLVKVVNEAQARAGWRYQLQDLETGRYKTVERHVLFIKYRLVTDGLIG